MSANPNRTPAPLRKFTIPLHYHSQDTYALRQSDIVSRCRPCALRLVDIGDWSPKFNKPQPGGPQPKLCMIEIRRHGHGAVGPFSKDGLVEATAKARSFSAVVSRDMRGPTWDTKEVLDEAVESDPDSRTPHVPTEEVLVSASILKTFYEYFEKSSKYKGSRELWIDQLCVFQGGSREGREDRRWHDAPIREEIFRLATRRYFLSEGLACLSTFQTATSYYHMSRICQIPGVLLVADNTFSVHCAPAGALLSGSSFTPLAMTRDIMIHGRDPTHLTQHCDVLTLMRTVGNIVDWGHHLSLAKMQALWSALFLRSYVDYYEFIDVCRVLLCKSPPASGRYLREQGQLQAMANLAADMSMKAGGIPFWLGAQINIPPCREFTLFPAIPLQRWEYATMGIPRVPSSNDCIDRDQRQFCSIPHLLKHQQQSSTESTSWFALGEAGLQYEHIYIRPYGTHAGELTLEGVQARRIRRVSKSESHKRAALGHRILKVKEPGLARQWTLLEEQEQEGGEFAWMVFIGRVYTGESHQDPNYSSLDSRPDHAARNLPPVAKYRYMLLENVTETPTAVAGRAKISSLASWRETCRLTGWFEEDPAVWQHGEGYDSKRPDNNITTRYDFAIIQEEHLLASEECIGGFIAISELHLSLSDRDCQPRLHQERDEVLIRGGARAYTTAFSVAVAVQPHSAVSLLYA
ncbi:hypothetical protein BV20DRAFT_1113711 [Pilatotrama ljubarskyi]|nr:hypothetical protein BV20DRAFT_1113711 [Pilatotrama ljubarskyi]